MTQSAGIRDTIAAANEQFMQAFSQQDAAAVAARYTEGGQLLPPNSDVVAGAEGIQAAWQAAMDAGIASVTLDVVEAEQHGDTAIEVGRYALASADGQTVDRGKYIVIWKREGGEWKLHRDIWCTSLPAPG